MKRPGVIRATGREAAGVPAAGRRERGRPGGVVIETESSGSDATTAPGAASRRSRSWRAR
jgi:hypothetical protein